MSLDFLLLVFSPFPAPSPPFQQITHKNLSSFLSAQPTSGGGERWPPPAFPLELDSSYDSFYLHVGICFYRITFRERFQLPQRY